MLRVRNHSEEEERNPEWRNLRSLGREMEFKQNMEFI